MTRPRVAVAGLLAIGVGLVAATAALGEPPRAPRPIEPAALTPIQLPLGSPVPTSAPIAGPIPSRTPPPIPTPAPTRPAIDQPAARVRAEPRPTPAPSVTAKPVAYRHSFRGTASWYCKAGVSPCTSGYPPGSMVAAACRPLRRAIGADWRGQRVAVTNLSNGRTVSVRLVDWCGSTDKAIDLYWEPMSRLGGSGVLAVRVAWR